MKKSLYLLIVFFLFTIKLSAIEDIIVNNEQIIPTFSKDTTTYNVYVNESTEIITINAKESENELITGHGSKSLKKGLNTFEINSYINNSLIKTYTLNIIRGIDYLDENSSILESLSIEGYNIDFKSDKHTYNINVSNDLDLNIKYKKSNPKSNVKLVKTSDSINIKVISENKKNETTYKINLIKDELVSSLYSPKNTRRSYNDFELKLIRIAIITVSSIIIGIIFYLIFIKKKKNT